MCKYIKKRILSLSRKSRSVHLILTLQEDDQICVHCQCCEANFEMASWRWDNLGFSRMCLIRIAFCASLSSCFLSAHHCWVNFKISGTRFHNWSFPHKIPPVVTLLVTANLMNGYVTDGLYSWCSPNLAPFHESILFEAHKESSLVLSPVKSVWPRIGVELSHPHPLPLPGFVFGSNWMALS